MSEAGEPPPTLSEEQVIPDSQQPSTSSAKMEQEPPPPPPFLGAGNTGSPDSESSSPEVDIMSALGEEQVSPVSQQPSASSATMQPEPQPLLEAGDEETTDSVTSSVDAEIMSISASAARSRLWTPPSSASSAPMELKIQPFVKAGGGAVKWPGQARGGPQNFRWANRPTRRSYSPQPFTSTGLPRDLQPLFDRYDLSVCHMHVQDLSMSTRWLRPWSPPTEPVTPAGLLLELELMQSANKRNTEGTPESLYSRLAGNISPPPRRAGSRPWSPQPATQDQEDDDLMSQQFIDYSEVARDFSIPRSQTSWLNMPPPENYAEASSLGTDAWETSPTPPLRGMLRRWPSQQLSTPAERAQMEMRSRMEDATSADMSYAAENLSMPAGEQRGAKKRPWSPQASTSTEMLQSNVNPIMQAIESNADAFSMSLVHNICALVDEKRKRMGSPQPGPSSAPDQFFEEGEIMADADSASAAENLSVPVGEEIAPPTSEPSDLTTTAVEAEQPPEKEAASKDPPDSVYGHVPHDISNIPQLRGLKAGRRHGRLRRLYTQNKINEKYGPIIRYIGPMVAEERAKQQLQQVLIASALDHFANTINQIADMCEGKLDTTGFKERLEEFKKKMENRRASRCKHDPNATEESLPRPPSSPPELSDEEINRRLREEVEAAVEALLTGDRSKEYPPSRVAEIIKSFQDAYNPK